MMRTSNRGRIRCCNVKPMGGKWVGMNLVKLVLLSLCVFMFSEAATGAGLQSVMFAGRDCSSAAPTDAKATGVESHDFVTGMWMDEQRLLLFTFPHVGLFRKLDTDHPTHVYVFYPARAYVTTMTPAQGQKYFAWFQANHVLVQEGFAAGVKEVLDMPYKDFRPWQPCRLGGMRLKIASKEVMTGSEVVFKFDDKEGGAMVVDGLNATDQGILNALFFSPDHHYIILGNHIRNVGAEIDEDHLLPLFGDLCPNLTTVIPSPSWRQAALVYVENGTLRVVGTAFDPSKAWGQPATIPPPN